MLVHYGRLWACLPAGTFGSEQQYRLVKNHNIYKIFLLLFSEKKNSEWRIYAFDLRIHMWGYEPFLLCIYLSQLSLKVSRDPFCYPFFSRFDSLFMRRYQSVKVLNWEDVHPQLFIYFVICRRSSTQLLKHLSAWSNEIWILSLFSIPSLTLFCFLRSPRILGIGSVYWELEVGFFCKCPLL